MTRNRLLLILVGMMFALGTGFVMLQGDRLQLVVLRRGGAIIQAAAQRPGRVAAIFGAGLVMVWGGLSIASYWQLRHPDLDGGPPDADRPGSDPSNCDAGALSPSVVSLTCDEVFDAEFLSPLLNVYLILQVRILMRTAPAIELTAEERKTQTKS